jgi:hypothetical protein
MAHMKAYEYTFHIQAIISNQNVKTRLGVNHLFTHYDIFYLLKRRVNITYQTQV